MAGPGFTTILRSARRPAGSVNVSNLRAASQWNGSGLSTSTLCGAVNAYVMQDEARHVAFGRLALRKFYPQLSDAERDEREEFVVEACYLMRDRFRNVEVWAELGYDPQQVIDLTDRTPGELGAVSRLR